MSLVQEHTESRKEILFQSYLTIAKHSMQRLFPPLVAKHDPGAPAITVVPHQKIVYEGNRRVKHG